MARVFKRNNAGIKALLKSYEVVKMTEQYAREMANGAETQSFVGFDRGKTIIKGDKKT